MSTAEDLKSFFIKKKQIIQSANEVLRNMDQKLLCLEPAALGWLFCSVPGCCCISLALRLAAPGQVLGSAERQGAALQCTRAPATKTPGPGWKCTSLGSNLLNCFKLEGSVSTSTPMAWGSH